MLSRTALPNNQVELSASGERVSEMTSWDEIPETTEAKARERFNFSLKNAVELGEWPRLSLMLAPQVFQAVSKVAESYPDVDAELVKKATTTFETQQDRDRQLYG